MHFTKKDITDASKVFRLNLINSITGIKPGNLIGTKSAEGISNLGVFSSVVHLGSSPALLGFILRPEGEVPRHTMENIEQTGYYTINHIHESFISNAHYTSAKFDAHISEFEACNLTEQYLEGFSAPFVKESQIKIAMKFADIIPIPLNNTSLVIGEIEHILIPDTVISPNGRLNLSAANSVGISGLNRYYSLKMESEFPYARVDELPKF
jgi:flavin reductase (DIM6/NTAB) family NADH-FMN oxidoreductase RutF